VEEAFPYLFSCALLPRFAPLLWPPTFSGIQIYLLPPVILSPFFSCTSSFEGRARGKREEGKKEGREEGGREGGKEGEHLKNIASLTVYFP
jgi:hypothetical protein